MKFIKYSKFVGNPFDSLSAEDLLRLLEDFLLDSGYHSYNVYEFNPERTLEQLHRALLEAMREQEMIPDRLLRQMLENATDYRNSELAQLINSLLEKLAEEGYISIESTPPKQAQVSRNVPGQMSEAEGTTRFEITDKALDFLGYKSLKDLLASIGKSSFGRHDTRELATGIEAHGSSKPYQFGETLNLDVNATLLAAIRRSGLHLPLELDYPDLQVRQCEYQSSCATVLMLDCSHSMILYGEDRFTPAKKVALALTHLIRTQYPGDSLQLVLFHDSAEEVPLAQLARVQVGPYYTNTREGLRVAQRILARQKQDMRQIVMITDGKPTALTLDNGKIYRNAFGLDPLVVSETLHDVARCRRSNILINTFMLASDYGLVDFVQKVTEICRGKAYFTTPFTLGQYLLMDYMQKKVKHIH